MFIVDAHEDLAYIALHDKQDVRYSVYELHPGDNAQGRSSSLDSMPMIGLPELRRGGIGLIFASIFAPPASIETVIADGQAQLRYYQELAATEPQVRLIYRRSALDALLHDWQLAETPDKRPVGLVLLMEGADPIRKPSELVDWYVQGLRIIGPSWERSRYAGGTGAPGPLTSLGRVLLSNMEQLGIILDVSHLAEESFWQALELFHGTVIASHSNCRAYIPTDRHLTDDMIRAIAERDGVIGTVLLNIFLDANWKPETNASLTIDVVVRQIDRVCQITGSASYSAIGSDFGVGYAAPVEFDSIADIAKLVDVLANKGYSDTDIENIMGGNWLRVLRRALPE
jgi:membrane dipeptidase